MLDNIIQQMNKLNYAFIHLEDDSLHFFKTINEDSNYESSYEEIKHININLQSKRLICYKELIDNEDLSYYIPDEECSLTFEELKTLSPLFL